MTQWIKRLLNRREDRGTLCSAVVPAAGSSARMGGENKLLLPLGDVPVLLRTLRALDTCPRIHEIVVVTREDQIVPISQLCQDGCFSKVKCVVTGGASRAESVLRGIQAVCPETELIAIHDGARPLVSQTVLDAVIRKAEECGAAAPAVPVKDTIKQAVGGVVERTPDRSELFAVQTPQVFEASLIRGALAKALEEGAQLTDDCSAVERIGMKVSLTPGEYTNLKITTPEDLILAEALLNRRDDR